MNKAEKSFKKYESRMNIKTAIRKMLLEDGLALGAVRRAAAQSPFCVSDVLLRIKKGQRKYRWRTIRTVKAHC